MTTKTYDENELREKFEDWIMKYDIALVRMGDVYTNSGVTLAWEAWKAAAPQPVADAGDLPPEIQQLLADMQEASKTMDGVSKWFGKYAPVLRAALTAQSKPQASIDALYGYEAGFDDGKKSKPDTTKIDIHVLLDHLFSAARGQPIDPESCELIERIAKDWKATFDEDDIQALYDCGPKPDDKGRWQPTHRHKKRGTDYKRMGTAIMQCENEIFDMKNLTLYQDEDGQYWVRPPSEFNDGRFEPLPSAPTKENEK